MNVFVAGFIGSPPMNLLRVAASGGIDLLGRRFAAPREAGAEIIVGVRPEDLRVAASGGIAADVELVENLGFESLLHCVVRHPGDPLDGQRLVVRHNTAGAIARGGQINVESAGDATVHVFDPSTELRIGTAGRAG